MELHVATLMAVGSFIAALSGISLVASWSQMREASALLWWSVGFFLYSVGIAILVVGIGGGVALTSAIGGTLAAASPLMIWAGTRRFEGRKTSPWWIAAWIVPLAAAGSFPNGHQLAGYGLWIVFLSAAIWELWRERSQSLGARWVLIALFAVHILIFLGGGAELVGSSVSGNPIPPLESWFGLIHFETLIYSVGAAIAMIILCKERIQQRQIAAARLDSLTGASTRGPFLENAGRLLRRAQTDGESFSLVMFDLDQFKALNDSYGHAAGDLVLRAFADTVREVLRPQDIFCRYGGEEFAIALPGARIEVAYAVAERIRHRVGEASVAQNGASLEFKVSGGVAAGGPGESIDDIMRRADDALYRAKRLGRNRIERASSASDEEVFTNVVRIA